MEVEKVLEKYGFGLTHKIKKLQRGDIFVKRNEVGYLNELRAELGEMHIENPARVEQIFSVKYGLMPEELTKDTVIYFTFKMVQGKVVCNVKFGNFSTLEEVEKIILCDIRRNPKKYGMEQKEILLREMFKPGDGTKKGLSLGKNDFLNFMALEFEEENAKKFVDELFEACREDMKKSETE